jgi:hypothetical protein
MAREEELMRAGLRRLLGEGGCRLFGNGRGRAIYPQRTASAQRAAEMLVERNFVEPTADSELFRLTPSGMAWLVECDDPQVLLEDLLRASESQLELLRELESQHRLQAERMEHQRTAISAVLARLPAVRRAEVAIEPEIGAVLAEHRQSGNLADCSVSELYDRLRRRHPYLTIGQFHDSLRSLREAGRLRLAPWTGPLYQLPQPALALLIGHEVLYYVQLQPGTRAA